MEAQKPKIALYVQRSFGEKLTATFDFIKENWKPLMKFTTYLMLPLCLLQGLSLNGLMSGTMALGDMTGGSFDSSVVGASIMALVTYYSLYAVLYLLGTVMLTSLVYALVRTYNEREKRLEGVTLGMLKPLLFGNVRRVFLIMIVGVLLVLFVGLIVGFIATVIPFMAIAFLFVLLEDIYIIDALKKAYRLGFATWGGIVLISIVMGFIAAILQGVTMIPWYIGTIVKYIFAMTDAGGGATVSAAYSFVLYLLAVVQAFGVYMSMIFSLLGLAYQYGHASEKIDYVMVESDIDNFDKL